MSIMTSSLSNLVFAAIALAWIAGNILWAVRSQAAPRGKLVGRGVATTLVGIFFIFLGYAVYGALQCAKLKAEQVGCQENMKTLADAVLQYTQAHNDHLPPASSWATDISPYLDASSRRQVFQCPDANTPYSYAFNTALGGKSLNNIAKPADAVMLFESDAKALNATGSVADFNRDRHEGMSNVAYVDGHVRAINSYTIGTLVWKP